MTALSRLATTLNDSLLQLTSQAYSQGGQYYVPISVFSEFRIYSHYYDTTSTAQLYSSSKQMFFNIETGETYDSDDNYYTSSAIMRGGQVYVPVDFVCRHKKLVIEIDGGQHNTDNNIIYDNERTNFLETEGYKVLRFWNNDIDNNIEGVYEEIYKHLL